MLNVLFKGLNSTPLYVYTRNKRKFTSSMSNFLSVENTFNVFSGKRADSCHILAPSFDCLYVDVNTMKVFFKSNFYAVNDAYVGLSTCLCFKISLNIF